MENKEERYCICEEIINGVPSGCFTIRVESDCNPNRFKVIGTFDTFERAEQAYQFMTD